MRCFRVRYVARPILCLMLATLATARLVAQERPRPTPVVIDTAMITAAAATITAPDIQRAIEVLASDSLRNRQLGSPGLDRAAAYLSREFARIGLVPKDTGDSTSDTVWRQRYRMPGALIPYYAATSLAFTLRFRAGGRDLLDEGGSVLQANLQVNFTDAVRFGVDTILQFEGGSSAGSMVLIAGRQTPATVLAAKLRDEFVLYVPARDADSATRHAVLTALNATNHVVMLSDEDSATFAARRAAEEAHPPVVIERAMAGMVARRYWTATVWAPRLSLMLQQAGVNLARVGTDTTAVLRQLPLLHVRMQMNSSERRGVNPSGFNVVGVLPGVDSSISSNGLSPVSRDVLVVSARLDAPDSLNNASDLAGLLAIAQAMRQPRVQHRRTILFVATTGAAQEHVGARAFAEAYSLNWDVPSLLNITLDGLDGPPVDSVTVDGLRDFEFVHRPEREVLRHPELGLAVVDGGSSMAETSDHVAFAERGIVSLRVSAGDIAERPMGTVARASDPELVARRARFVYYVMQAAANELTWPGFTQQGRAGLRLLRRGD